MPPAAHRIDAQNEALAGTIILITLSTSFTARYAALIGHTAPLPFRADLAFLSTQLFFALAACQLAREAAPSARHYVAARLDRFVPIVIPGVLISAAAAALAGLPAFPTWQSLALNLTMLADFTGAPDGLGAYWRIKIEIMFAAAFGLLRFGATPRTACALLAAALAACALLPPGEPAHQATLTPPGLLTMDGFLPALAAGTLIGLLAEGGPRAILLPLLAAAALLVLRGNAGTHGALVLAAIGLVALASRGALPLLGRIPPLRALGRIFFAIFCVHLLPGFAIIGAAERHGIPPGPAIAAATAAAVALGALIHTVLAPLVRAAALRPRALPQPA